MASKDSIAKKDSYTIFFSSISFTHLSVPFIRDFRVRTFIERISFILSFREELSTIRSNLLVKRKRR